MMRCLVVFMMTLTTVLLLDFKSMNVYAIARCVNATDNIVAYVDSPIACPTGSHFKSELPAVSQPSTSQIAQAQAQASSDKEAVYALDLKAEKEARMLIKNQLVAQKHNTKMAKRCKLAELNLDQIKAKYAEANSNQFNKSQNDAQRRLEYAQAKRDLACTK
jgi:hypothetical protein